MKPDVVLGAGVAGLAATHYLSHRSRQPVIVLEREERVGGLAATLNWEGCRIDLGPHRIYTLLPEIERFILDLLGEEVLRVKRCSSMFLRSRYLRYPVSFGEILRTLGPACAARIGLGYFGGLPNSWRKPAGEEVSYAEYITSRFGGYLYRLLFRDYAIKVWQEDPNKLSADMARVRLAAPSLWASALEALRPTGKGAVSEFLYPRGGIGRLSEKMAQDVRNNGGSVCLGHEVRKLRIEEGRVVSIAGRGPKGPFEIEPEQAISTLPLPALLQALEPAPPGDVLQAVNGLAFANTILVYGLFDRPQIRPDTWLYFPDRDVLFTRTYEVNNFDRGNVPEGQSCLCLEVPCREGDAIWNLSDGEIAAQVREGMQKVGLAKDAKWIASRTIRLRNVYPIYDLGYASRLERVTTYLMKIQNLVSTGRGGLFCYNNSDHSIDMGLLAAEYLLGEHREGEGTGRFYRLRPRFEQYRIVD